VVESGSGDRPEVGRYPTCSPPRRPNHTARRRRSGSRYHTPWHTCHWARGRRSPPTSSRRNRAAPERRRSAACCHPHWGAYRPNTRFPEPPLFPFPPRHASEGEPPSPGPTRGQPRATDTEEPPKTRDVPFSSPCLLRIIPSTPYKNDSLFWKFSNLYIVGCRKFLFPREYQRKKSQKLTKTPFLCEGSHMKHVGIALSGGGVAGCAHLGVLYGLEKADISVGYIAGTSAGAIVA